MLGRFLRQVAGDAIVQMAMAVLACWGACRLIEAVSARPVIETGADGEDADYSPALPPVRAKLQAYPAAPGAGRLVSWTPRR
jgi:hypothetical protein